ncbi:hypothetical protein D3C76_937090 [compost metagenome]
MQGTDRQCVGAAFARHPGQVFQCLGVAKAAIAGTAQCIQLHAQAPGARDRAVHRIGYAVATGGSHGQGKALSIDLDVLVTDRDQPRQNGFGIQLETEFRAIFKMDLAGCQRLKKVRQVKSHADIGGDQRRQVAGLLYLLQFEQAGVDFLGAAGRVAESREDVAQNRRRDFLRTTVGVDPVDRQASPASKDFQLRITHWRSPSRGSKGAAAVRLTIAQYGGKVPWSSRWPDPGGCSNSKLASTCGIWRTGVSLRLRSMRN